MSIPTETFDSAFKRRLRSAVLKWYDKHGRKLPWRNSADPYRVWLSEIMLQQTTVAAVVPYFERFIARFPDVQSLATEDVDDVLRLWEGLGYYSRARNLHKAAGVIVNEHGGKFPSDVAVLQTLPGIGRYTAAAIASFAFNRPAAIVEANTERLYARLIALHDDVRSTQSQKTLWKFANGIVSSNRSGDFNQALMDIGSQICRSVAPDCPKCPLVSCCQALKLGLQNVVPVRKARTPITAVTEVCIVIRRGNKLLLRRRTEAERWAGMWDFLRFEIDDSESLPSTVIDRIREQTGLSAVSVADSTEFTYSVTRYRVLLKCFFCEALSAIMKRKSGQQWFKPSELADLPLSITGRKVADWVRLRNPEI